MSIATDLQAMLDRDAAEVPHGHFDGAMAHYRVPFVAQMADRMMLYRNREGLHASFISYHSILVRHGVTEIRPRLKLVDTIAPGRFRAWVMNRFYGPEGQLRATGTTIFFGRYYDDVPLYEMQHITHLPFAEMRGMFGNSWTA